MKRILAIVTALALLTVFLPACESDQTVRFQLKLVNQSLLDYFICSENQDVKIKLDLENSAYTQEENGARIYDLTVYYPKKVTQREDGRSFWTFYSGFIYEYSETFSYTLPNVGIRSGHTTVILDRSGGSVLYDTAKTVYDDGNFTFYVGEGMRSESNMLQDFQFIWYEDEDGQRQGAGEFLPYATIQLLGVNEPNANGDVETWFSVISGAEGVGELHRFCVTTKGEEQAEKKPENTLTYADLPDVVSEEGAKWLDDAEFAADGIKPTTDVATMKAVFGEPVSSRKKYGDDAEYIIYRYDGVVYTIETAMKSVDEWLEVNRAYTVDFTKNLLDFPRGIKIGNSFEDVLKKFPQEMDYKNGINTPLFYGDFFRKDKVGWGSVRLANNEAGSENGVWISVICDEYWPMLKVHFSDELIADKIVVQFGPSLYYN